MKYLSICSGIEAASVAWRFWEKIAKGQENNCWKWTAAKHTNGYGKMGGGGKHGKTLLAHHVSYELHYGAIPNGMFVCHSCDNRLCVNPAHLWLGTASDNVSDMMEKDRWRGYDKRGERNPSAKLTAAQVNEIRERARAGENQSRIAEQFGVSRQLVSEIKRGNVWA